MVLELLYASSILIFFFCKILSLKGSGKFVFFYFFYLLLLVKQVCHRDLKLENTLLDGSPAPRLKICDFGYSKVLISLFSIATISFCLNYTKFSRYFNFYFFGIFSLQLPILIYLFNCVECLPVLPPFIVSWV